MTQLETATLAGHRVNLAADQWHSLTGDRGRPEVILLHGGGQTRASWKGTGRRLAEAGWTTCAVDARGHGDSDWPTDRDYSTDALARDVYALATSRAVPPVLVGASMGGHAALIAIGENPGIASGLVLVDIAVTPSPAGLERIHEFMRNGLAGFDTVEDAASAVAAYNPHRAAPPKPDGLLRNLRERDGRWYWHWDPAFIEHGPRGEQDRQIRAREAAQQITVPTLLVKGAQSDIVTTDAAHEIQQLIPHSTFVEVGGTGHMVSGDDNDAFATAVLGFLAELHR